MSFKNETEMTVLLQVKSKLLSSSELEKNCAHFYHLPVILLRGAQNIDRGAKYCVEIL